MLPLQKWCCLGKLLEWQKEVNYSTVDVVIVVCRWDTAVSISEAESMFLWQGFGYCRADPKYLTSKLNLTMSSKFSLVLSAQFSCGGCFMSQGIRTAPSLTDQHWSDWQWCKPSVLALDFLVCNLKCYPFFKSILNLPKVCKCFSMLLLMNPKYYPSNCSKNPCWIFF